MSPFISSGSAPRDQSTGNFHQFAQDVATAQTRRRNPDSIFAKIRDISERIDRARALGIAQRESDYGLPDDIDQDEDILTSGNQRIIPGESSNQHTLHTALEYTNDVRPWPHTSRSSPVNSNDAKPRPYMLQPSRVYDDDVRSGPHTSEHSSHVHSDDVRSRPHTSQHTSHVHIDDIRPGMQSSTIVRTNARPESMQQDNSDDNRAEESIGQAKDILYSLASAIKQVERDIHMQDDPIGAGLDTNDVDRVTLTDDDRMSKQFEPPLEPVSIYSFFFVNSTIV